MSQINYPSLIFTTERTFKVEGEFNSSDLDMNNSFIEGKGYLDTADNHVWVFSQKKPKDANQYPYFWIESDNYVKSDPVPEIYRLFKEDKLVNYNTDNIIKKTNESDNTDPIYVDAVIDNLNASSEIFRPVMYTKDDFLKKLTKTIINELNIRPSKYKARLSQKYMMSNMISALRSPTKMSTMYFNAWCELLGLKATIIVESTDDAEDKLDEPYVYVSEKDAVFKLSELDPDFKFPEIPVKEVE